jgi:O-antigen/teichoic acid export membrane protein
LKLFRPKKNLVASSSEIFSLLVRNTAMNELKWLITGNILGIGLGFISMKLLSTMGTAEFGKYSLIVTVAAFFSTIFYGPVEQSYLRFYYDYKDKGLASYFFGLFLKYLAGISLLIVILSLVILPFTSHFDFLKNYSEILMIACYVIFFNTSNTLNSLLNLLRKRKINTIIQFIERVLIILIIGLIYFFTNLNSIYAIISISMAAIVSMSLKIFFLRKFTPGENILKNSEIKNYRRQIIKTVLVFSAPFVIWGITGWLQSNSERWIIVNYLSASDVGIFSLMALIVNYFITIPVGMINQFCQPIIFEKYSINSNSKQKHTGQQVFTFAVLITLIIIILSSAILLEFGKQIIVLLSNDKFASYWQGLILLCIGYGLFQLGQIYIIPGIIRNKPHKYLWVKVFTGILAVLLNILFIFRFGFWGILISIYIINLVYLVLVLVTNKKCDLTLPV